MNVLFALIVAVTACKAPPRGPAPGDVDQQTGLIRTETGWTRGWWQDQFEAAKAQGCHLEDSCGIFPPYYIPAQYCGDPITVCPGGRR